MSIIKKSSRYDFSIIANWVPSDSKVLDLGCGDGELLNYLKAKKNVKGFGVEKDELNWLDALKNNIDVIQLDIESGLSEFETNSPLFEICSYHEFRIRKQISKDLVCSETIILSDFKGNFKRIL